MESRVTLKKDEEGRVYICLDGEPMETDKALAIIKMLRKNYERHWYIYMGLSSTKQLFKIGVSLVPEKRAKRLGILLLTTFPVYEWEQPQSIEEVLHSYFYHEGVHVEGEWFDLDGLQIGFIRSLQTAHDVLVNCSQTDEQLRKWRLVCRVDVIHRKSRRFPKRFNRAIGSEKRI